ncbi:hypothetical protein [Secundilactobacillus folii]|uniref:Uncharacterized protein n=1 Tax=Secundilactobacillus folii TaxID=2678357 RepID=A0A7X2XWI6_9LACO|nr:hypothetical protein [Secundilactobacillus folii]MTV81591.1 hypothetical protein [Secundilactobacillus folii]
MGFWIMLSSALLGTGTTYYALKITRSPGRTWLCTVIGVVLIVFAIIIATPQGAQAFY